MDLNTVATEIQTFVVGESGLEDASFLSKDTDLMEAGILDSLMMVSIITFCEERFGCAFSLEELTEENFRSVSTIADFLSQKLGVGNPNPSP